jgi:histidine triad (HIT) family protein
MRDSNCIFCKIVAGSIPARIMIQNEKAMAMLDAFPLAVGHTLIIPKSHYTKIQDMGRDDAMAMFEITWKIVSNVESGSEVNASTIAIHNGKEAGQEIPHVHVHIVPRKIGDGAGAIHSMFKNKPKLSPEHMEMIANRIIGSGSSNLS